MRNSTVPLQTPAAVPKLSSSEGNGRLFHRTSLSCCCLDHLVTAPSAVCSALSFPLRQLNFAFSGTSSDGNAWCLQFCGWTHALAHKHMKPLRHSRPSSFAGGHQSIPSVPRLHLPQLTLKRNRGAHLPSSLRARLWTALSSCGGKGPQRRPGNLSGMGRWKTVLLNQFQFV